MLLKTARFMSLICAALALGLTTAHVLERPGKTQLTADEWLQVQHTFYGGFAVAGGLAETVGLVASIGCLALLGNDRLGGWLSAPGVAGFAGMLVGCAFGNRPINDQIASWTPATIPTDWTIARVGWENAHAITAAFAALAFVGLLVAILHDPARS